MVKAVEMCGKKMKMCLEYTSCVVGRFLTNNYRPYYAATR